MQEDYIYHTVPIKPTKAEIEEKKIEGWELCSPPGGVIGRDLEKESHSNSIFYFRQKKN
jgi:hypothetical protein